MIPTFRHTHFEQFAACPFAFAAGLLSRVGTEGIGPYLSDQAQAAMVAQLKDIPDLHPVPRDEFATVNGQQFHRFAHAYGIHCRNAKVRGDLERADVMARGYAEIDGEYRHSLHEMMVHWAQIWEFPAGIDGDPTIPLTSGSFEDGQRVTFSVFGREFGYEWHPDYAQISEDLGVLMIADWKTGMKGATYDPSSPNPQLLRYAVAFNQMFNSQVQHVSLQLWFTNKKNPSYFASDWGEPDDEGEGDFYGGPLT